MRSPEGLTHHSPDSDLRLKVEYVVLPRDDQCADIHLACVSLSNRHPHKGCGVRQGEKPGTEDSGLTIGSGGVALPVTCPSRSRPSAGDSSG